MKKWIPPFLILASVALVIFYDVTWQAMSMVVVGVTALGKLILGGFASRRPHIRLNIRQQSAVRPLGETGHLLGLEADVENMSDLELMAAGRDYFGT